MNKFYAISGAVAFVLFTSCNSRVDAEYIRECAHIEGAYTVEKATACMNCCVNNGWDYGTFYEVGTVGCQCTTKK